MTGNSLTFLKTRDLAGPLAEQETGKLAAELGQLSGSQVYKNSLAASGQTLFFLMRVGKGKMLGVLTSSSGTAGVPPQFTGETQQIMLRGEELSLRTCPTSAANAGSIRALLPFLVPRPLGLRKSVGCGDRLGLATPGHIRAVQHTRLAPILAQQSIRENARTGRTPQEVMDDAMWSVFQEGWSEGFGADADHLKTTDDIDVCAAAGYTFYTIDPGEHVDDEANTAPLDLLKQKVARLPWGELESSWEDLRRQLHGQPIDLGDFNVSISEEELLHAVAKYGRVVAHTANMYRHLQHVMKERSFELEMSVDETETVTTLSEHLYIAHELKRLGIKWVSLAPRYIGTFEKGVDYIGDLNEFERSFAEHLAVARIFGPYKLSLHSGSDKFRLYPIAARLAGELVHLKTAGTSYLEALRAIARLNPKLFREIVGFAINRYPIDRATYHVSAELERMPDVNALPNDRLTILLDNFHVREVLHVTFGSVLKHSDFREPFFMTLRADEETYYQMLETHFAKHLAPFSASSEHNRETAIANDE
jgi:hypothetical protein